MQQIDPPSLAPSIVNAYLQKLVSHYLTWRGNPILPPKFSLFNFGFEAPLTWGLRIRRNSNSLSGAISLISRHEREGRIFVMWGSQSTVGKYDSRYHANEGARLVKQSERWKDSDFTRLVWHVRSIATHEAHGFEFPSSRTMGYSSLKPYAVSYRVKTFYLHCRTSGRYFIISGELTTGTGGSEEVYNDIVESFACHELSSSQVLNIVGLP